MKEAPMTFPQMITTREATHDVVCTEKVDADITGDLVAGTVLSQIVYWHGNSKSDGKPRLRISREGKLWLAKGRTEWWDEVRVTAHQADRVLNLLKKMNLIETKVFRFRGNPTLHIHLNQDEYMAYYNAAMKERRNDGESNLAEPMENEEEIDTKDCRDKKRFSGKPKNQIGENRKTKSGKTEKHNTNDFSDSLAESTSFSSSPTPSSLPEPLMNDDDFEDEEPNPELTAVSEEEVALRRQIAAINGTHECSTGNLLPNWVRNNLEEKLRQRLLSDRELCTLQFFLKEVPIHILREGECLNGIDLILEFGERTVEEEVAKGTLSKAQKSASCFLEACLKKNYSRSGGNSGSAPPGSAHPPQVSDKELLDNDPLWQAMWAEEQAIRQQLYAQYDEADGTLTFILEERDEGMSRARRKRIKDIRNPPPPREPDPPPSPEDIEAFKALDRAEKARKERNKIRG